MSTGLLEQRANYPRTQYEYGPAKGYNDADNDGRKEIDCSGLLYRMLKDAGYTIPYLTTGQLNTDVTYFDVVPLASVEAGDIALWINFNGHTGVIERINSERNAGDFFGSQSSSGPKSAKYGDGSGYWPMPEKFLRPKAQYRTGAQPTPAAAPAPAAVPAGPAPLMSFQYPFRKADGKQFTDAEEVYKALENEKSGHYLLGSNNFWHGGIHISNVSAPQCVLDEPVRCMADGEVVAYRLNDDYLESTFGDGDTAKKLKYSNSFCLVRHEYKSAPNPEEGPNKGKQNKLNFFSLYMHLLPHARYPLSPEETPAKKVTMKVGDFNAYPTAPPAGVVSQPDGKLVNGTQLEILETAESGELTYAKGKILSGSVKKGTTKTRGVGDVIWFAYLKNGVPYRNTANTQIWKEELLPERLRPNYWQGKVKAKLVKRLPLYDAPATPTNGQPAGSPKGTLQLNVDSVIEFDSKEVLNLTVGNQTQRMAACTLVSGALWGNGVVPPTFWACVENVLPNKCVSWQTVTPSEFDSVVVAGTGIKAGDPIGYLGQTENLTSEQGASDSKFQVHVEIFTAEADVKDFLKNFAGLKTGKQYLQLPAGTELKNAAPATGTTPLKLNHAVDLGKTPVIKVGTEDWYNVSVTDDGQPVSGLVQKAGANIITQHDWEKLGYQIVEETNATADGFLDPEDMPQFFKDLFAKIDANHDGQVDSAELAEALKNAETRSRWSKLIAHHPTEWKDKADSGKWSKLDQLLETSPKTLKHEKERISKYVFWGELSGKAAIESGLIYHFHPIGFIANSLAVDDDNDLRWLKVDKGQLTFDVEGNDLEDPANPLHMYFSRKVHWPGGVSGVTIGRGYDLGQRPNPESDLAAVGIKEPLLGWLLGAKGLSGSAARNYLQSASPEIRKIFITRKQQHQLFVPIYEFMKSEVVRISDKTDAINLYGRLNWDSTNPRIQDMAIDLIYRGDYTGDSRALIQRHMTDNNLSAFSDVIGDRSKWGNVPEDRFNRRVDYLR
ncbi:hypothetical protein ACF6ZU_12145 [Pseudomonas migulae]|uniref:hypothetical protein n=1 Tax=Pseudomonas migulae TaxID=78543 RepID=UPI003717BBCC